MLTPQAAQAIGLALHELGTNAIKHGAWSVPTGKVLMTWTFDADPEAAKVLQVRWEERGGPPVIRPVSKGFGHAVIDTMVGQATGGEVRMDFGPVGLRWILSVPASPEVIS
jgi:two-component sensor histidine kinase